MTDGQRMLQEAATEARQTTLRAFGAGPDVDHSDAAGVPVRFCTALELYESQAMYQGELGGQQ